MLANGPCGFGLRTGLLLISYGFTRHGSNERVFPVHPSPCRLCPYTVPPLCLNQSCQQNTCRVLCLCPHAVSGCDWLLCLWISLQPLWSPLSNVKFVTALLVLVHAAHLALLALLGLAGLLWSRYVSYIRLR